MYIFTKVSIYHGETFALSVCVVGYDFGTTVGVVHAGFLLPNSTSRLAQSQGTQSVNSSEICTSLEYTVLTKHDTEMLKLQTSALPVTLQHINDLFMFKRMLNCSMMYMYSHHDHGCINEDFLGTPVFVSITLLPGCPQDLTLTHGETRCNCYSILTNFKCSVQTELVSCSGTAPCG